MSAKKKKSQRAPAGDPERLDATPERLTRAREAGQSAERGVDRLRRILDPFDVMRSTRALAPHDPKLNDIRWLTGEALRRVHQRANLDALRAVAPDGLGVTGFGPRSGLPLSEIALHARDKIRAAEQKAGPAAWPIVARPSNASARFVRRRQRHLAAKSWKKPALASLPPRSKS